MGRVEDPRQLELLVAPRVVGFWAPAPQSGKSTAAEALRILARYEHSRPVARIAFADPMRSIIQTILREIGVPAGAAFAAVQPDADKETPIPGAYGRSFAELAIKVGTDVGRGWLDPEVWVNALRAKAVSFLEANPDGLVIVDDVRFRNEAALVRELGGVMIGVERPGATVSAARAAAEGHLTMVDMDAVIVNDSHLFALREAVVDTATKLGLLR
jgi:hypothetical protein